MALLLLFKVLKLLVLAKLSLFLILPMCLLILFLWIKKTPWAKLILLLFLHIKRILLYRYLNRRKWKWRCFFFNVFMKMIIMVVLLCKNQDQMELLLILKTLLKNLFEKKLPNYKEKFIVIFIPHPPLKIIKVNTTFGHVFNHLHNYPIIITYGSKIWIYFNTTMNS